jgi:hypothetical protein
MDTNPYGPPKSAVADISERGLKRRSVVVMIVLYIVTFGFYYPIWFLRRRVALNRLDSPRKLRLWPFLVYLAFFSLEFVGAFVAEFAPNEQPIEAGASVVFDLIPIAVGILMAVQCFITKDILEDHLIGPEDHVSASLVTGPVKLSGLKTFFLQIFYLQWVINRDIVASQRRAT